MSSSIQLVVFDLGRVMIHLSEGWEFSCARAGVPFRPFSRTDELQNRFDVLEIAISTGAISPAHFYEAHAQLLDGLYAPEEISRIYQAMICGEIEGIFDTVHALRAAGLRTACLSNTCAPHWVELTDPALYPGICALDDRYASHLFGFAKPDPRIYERFEAATGVQGDAILFFDDREENIVAARARGWQAVQIMPPASSSVAQIHLALSQCGVSLHPSCSR